MSYALNLDMFVGDNNYSHIITTNLSLPNVQYNNNLFSGGENALYASSIGLAPAKNSAMPCVLYSGTAV